MDQSREMDEFSRMRLVAEVDRINGLLATYQEHMGIYRDRLYRLHHLLGRLGERLGEPEPEEPRWR
jgi:hypothetical protein